MKKSIFSSFFVLLTCCAFCQLLTVEETINYLNSISKAKSKTTTKYDETKAGCIDYMYDEIKLNNNGTIVIYTYFSRTDCNDYLGYNQNQNLIQISTKSFHYSDIDLNYLMEYGKNSYHKLTEVGKVILFCTNKGKCIKYENYYELGYDSNNLLAARYIRNVIPETHYDYNFELKYDQDAYTSKKVLNAFIYLFSLMKESGKYERNDNDPFSDTNFNSIRKTEILGIANSSEIKLIREGSVYYVPVKIGTISKNFIIDSGAGEVSISNDFLELLKKEEKIIFDILSSGMYKLADGSVINCKRINIKKLQVGSFTISNVTASVGENDSPFLLGKSFFDKFSKWSINNITSTLHLEK